jgi:hypothetical protein
VTGDEGLLTGPVQADPASDVISQVFALVDQRDADGSAALFTSNGRFAFGNAEPGGGRPRFAVVFAADAMSGVMAGPRARAVCGTPPLRCRAHRRSGPGRARRGLSMFGVAGSR